MKAIRVYYKVFIAMLAAAVLIPFPLPAYAAASGTITDAISPISANADPDTSALSPGDTLVYPLTADMFTWSNGTGAGGDPVTTAQLKRGNIDVKYSTGQSKIIEDVILDTTTYNGQKTACINVEFVEEFEGVNSVDFKITIYLTVSRTKKEASQIILEGTFENGEIEVGDSDDYVDISDGRVLTPASYIDNLEIYLGDGVSLFTRVYSSKKYYGTATKQAEPTDESILSQYPDIDYVIRIRTVNLNPSGKCISLSGYDGYYVYDAGGAYLGRSDERLPFSSRYYLSGSKIDMGGDSSGGSSGSGDTAGTSGGSSAASSSGGSSGSGAPETATTDEIRASIKKEIDNSIAAAKAEGAGTAVVTTQDVLRVTAAELRYFYTAARSAGLNAKYRAYTMAGDGKTIAGCIVLEPALTVGLTGEIHLGASVCSNQVEPLTKTFGKFYSNKIAVVSLYQKGEFGIKISVAAKVDLDDMNAGNLVFYSYDKTGNNLQKLDEPAYYIDRNGYLHFNTLYGNDIIISDGPLRKN